jgi:tetratricopeptide (TPR) repeat protein
MQITRRWPDFAQGRLALAFDLLYYGNDDAVLSSTSKDAERAIEPLQGYIALVPDDPRPWRDLANAYMLIERNIEAESAFRSAIERDPTYLDHRASLVSFLLMRDEVEKAKADFGQMLKIAADPDEAFDGLYEEEGFDPEYAKSVENILLAFPKELAASKSGLALLANVQEAQNRPAEAVKSMQRAIAIKADPQDYDYISQLYRQQQRFTEALNAANQALKLDDQDAAAHFERACSFAQLGRKREALAALKQMIAAGPELLFNPDEPDLQPLANLPKFRALKEKMKGSLAAPDEKKAGDSPEEKSKKSRGGKP